MKSVSCRNSTLSSKKCTRTSLSSLRGMASTIAGTTTTHPQQQRLFCGAMQCPPVSAWKIRGSRRFLRGPDREKRKQGRKKRHGEKEGSGDTERDEVAEMTVWRHFGEVHAQESERRRQARQEYRVQVEADGFDDGVVAGITRSQTLLQGHQQVHAVRHDDHQHDGRRRRNGRGKRESRPILPIPMEARMEKTITNPGRHHPRPATGRAGRESPP